MYCKYVTVLLWNPGPANMIYVTSSNTMYMGTFTLKVECFVSQRVKNKVLNICLYFVFIERHISWLLGTIYGMVLN